MHRVFPHISWFQQLFPRQIEIQNMIMWYLFDHFFSHIIIQNSERMIILLSDEEIKICPVVDKDAL
jgi:hypothetical protein